MQCPTGGESTSNGSPLRPQRATHDPAGSGRAKWVVAGLIYLQKVEGVERGAGGEVHVDGLGGATREVAIIDGHSTLTVGDPGDIVRSGDHPLLRNGKTMRRWGTTSTRCGLLPPLSGVG
jgi:hypothetical protein